jgi:hypothetical protein
MPCSRNLTLAALGPHVTSFQPSNGSRKFSKLNINAAQKLQSTIRQVYLYKTLTLIIRFLRGGISLSLHIFAAASCVFGLSPTAAVTLLPEPTQHNTTQHNTTQQSGQTPDKEAVINHITVYVSGDTETDKTGMLPPNNETVLPQY